jgi:hypothetical protein
MALKNPESAPGKKYFFLEKKIGENKTDRILLPPIKL